jgi:putative Holliday junction resolvase
MKIMAIDYGDARTGVAFSDLTGSIAGETLVIKEWSQEALADKLAELFASRRAEKIVIGSPVNMDGTRGPRAEKSAQLAALLAEKTGVQPIPVDERLTTVDAHRILSEAGKRGKKRKEVVDAVAAQLILETYLNSER